MSSLLTEFLNPISIEKISRKDNIEKNKKDYAKSRIWKK